jgi:hypothetical protein
VPELHPSQVQLISAHPPVPPVPPVPLALLALAVVEAVLVLLSYRSPQTLE